MGKADSGWTASNVADQCAYVAAGLLFILMLGLIGLTYLNWMGDIKHWDSAKQVTWPPAYCAACARTHAHARTHARTARMQTHTHTLSLSLSRSLAPSLPPSHGARRAHTCRYL